MKLHVLYTPVTRWLTAHHCNCLRCWLVNWDTYTCWRSPLVWLTAREDSGQHYIFEDPICTHDTNKDPPFCTRFSPMVHPFAHATPKTTKSDWFPISKSGTNQKMLLWELTLYKAASDVCNIILSLTLAVSKLQWHPRIQRVWQRTSWQKKGKTP